MDELTPNDIAGGTLITVAILVWILWHWPNGGGGDGTKA